MPLQTTFPQAHGLHIYATSIPVKHERSAQESVIRFLPKNSCGASMCRNVSQQQLTKYISALRGNQYSTRRFHAIVPSFRPRSSVRARTRHAKHSEGNKVRQSEDGSAFRVSRGGQLIHGSPRRNVEGGFQQCGARNKYTGPGRRAVGVDGGVGLGCGVPHYGYTLSDHLGGGHPGAGSDPNLHPDERLDNGPAARHVRHN